MGQVVGTPVPHAKIAPFALWPKKAIENIWATYNLLGESWGLSIDDVTGIFQGSDFVAENLGITADDIKDLFELLDTDTNGIVDALELMVGIGVISGLDSIEKVIFVFSVFDFDSKLSLSYDELSLLLRSCATACNKIFTTAKVFQVIDSSDIDTYANLIAGDNKALGLRTSAADFQQYVTAHPVFSSWLDFLSASKYGLGLVTASNRSVIAGSAAINLVEDSLLPIIASVSDAAGTTNESTVNVVSTTNITSSTLEWFGKADSMRPEESLTLVPRNDPSEDVLEPLWIHGLNANTVKGYVAAYTNDNSILYSASRFLILLKRKVEEEGGAVSWSQTFKLDHQAPVASIELSQDRTMAVTTEKSGLAEALARPPIDGREAHDSVFSGRQYVHIWRVSPDLQLVNSLAFPSDTGIFMTSLSSDKNRVLVLTEEANINGAPQAFVSIFDVATKTLVSSIALRHNPSVISAISFATTNTIFTVTTTTSGVEFYVEEGANALGTCGYAVYSLRDPLYLKSTASTTSSSIAANATAITRFDGADEFVSGTSDGTVLFWQFRSCVQAIKVHDGPVAKLSYCFITQSVISSGASDGKIAILKLKRPTVVKNTRKTAVRSLEVVGVIDASYRHSLAKDSLAAIHSSLDGSRVLVPTKGGDVFELSLTGPEWKEIVKIVPVAGEGGEGGEGEAKGEEPPAEDGPPVVKLGDDLNKGPILSGHLSSNCGVTAVVKTGGGFITSGSDATLKMWNAAEGPQKVTKSVALKAVASRLAAGASYVAAGSAKTVFIYSLPELVLVTELAIEPTTNADADISDMKVAADNSLVISSADGSVSIYTAGADAASWVKKASFASLHAVERFDISSDGLCIRAMGPNQELSVTSIGGETVGAVITVPETLKALSWASNSVLYSWDTKGVFNYLNGSKDLSKFTSSDRNAALFLSGCDDGTIQLTRLPAFEYLPDDSKPRGALTRIAIHNGPLASLAFIEEGAKVVTAGANDGLVVVWKVTYDTEEAEVDAPPAEGEEGDETKTADEEEEGDGKPMAAPVVDSDEEEDFKDSTRFLEHLTARKKGSADKSAVSCWAASVDYDVSPTPRNADVAVEKIRLIKESLVDFVPTIPKTAKKAIARRAAEKKRVEAIKESRFDTLPSSELALAWVHGYSARTCKHGLRYNNRGSVVYPAGSNVIIYDKLEHAQIIVSAHNDAITALDLHSGSNVGASSHAGAGSIRVALWNATTGEVIKHISCGRVFGVSALSFSPCGRYIAAATLDAAHSVLIFDVSSGSLITRIGGGSKKILNLTFSQASSSSPSSFRLLAGGIGHFSLLDAKFGRSFSRKNGLYGAGNKKVDITCAASLPLAVEGGNEFVVGLSNGKIGVIARGDRRIGAYFDVVEKGQVTCVAVIKVKDATADEPSPVYKMLVGCTDGVIKPIDQEGQPIGEVPFNPYKAIPAVEGFIPAESSTYNLHSFGAIRGYRGFCLDKSQRKLLFGTSAGEIAEMEVDTGIDTNLGKGPLVAAHFRGKLEALAMHPIRQEVLTVGDDKILRIWSLAKHVMVNQIDIPDKATCAVYKPDGHLIAIGLIKRPEDPTNPSTKGTGVAIVSYLQSKLQVVHVTSDCQQAVSSCLFTPDGKQLYVASKEGKIFVYDALDNFALTNTLTAMTPCNCPEGCDCSTCGCSANSAPDVIEQLDVSSDSKIVVSYASSGKVRFWDNSVPFKNTPLSESKKLSFLASPSYFVRQGTSGLETLGIYKPDSVFGETSTVGLSKSSKLLISGDVFGAVRLYNASAKNLDAPHKSFTAHSAGGISKAAFSMQDEYVVTIGRSDRVMAVWRVVEDKLSCSHSFNEPVLSYLPRAVINSLNNVKLVEEEDSDAKTAGTFASSFEKNGVFFQPPSLETSCKSISASLSHIVGVGSNAVTKPLTDNVFLKHEMDVTVLKIMTEEEANASEPLGVQEEGGVSSIPASKISGTSESKIKPFRYSSTFFSLPVARYCGTRDVVTSSGKVVSVIRRVDGIKSSAALTIPSNINSSIFEDIGAVTTSPCARFIAVGTSHSWDAKAVQADAFEGSVHIYQVVTYRPVSSFARQIKGGVLHSAFSQDATLLAVLGGDLEHTVHLFRSSSGLWTDAELLSKTPTSLSELSLVAFYSSPPSSLFAGKVIVAVGGVGGLFNLVTCVSSRNVVKIERFWSVSGVASRALGVTAMTSVPFGSTLITGHEDGALLSWSLATSHLEGVGDAAIPVGKHNGPVSSLSAFFWDPNTEDINNSNSSNNSLNSPSSSSVKSKVASKLRSSLSAKAGIISGSMDGIQAFSVAPYSEDNRCLTQVSSVSASTLSDASTNHFVSGSAGGGVSKLHDDREIFVTSISSDCKFNKVVVALSSSQIVELSLDSLACHHLAYGDTRMVKATAAHPSNADIYATLTSDNYVNLWSLSTQRLLGQFAVPLFIKTLTATTIAFAAKDLLLVGSGDRHAHHGQSTGSLTAVKLDFLVDDEAANSSSSTVINISSVVTSAIDFIDNVGHGALSSIKVSADLSKVAACSEDGNVYLFRTNEPLSSGGEAYVQPLMSMFGALKVFGPWSPTSCDFSLCGNWLRCFGACESGDRAVQMEIFDVSGVEAAAAAATAASVALREQEVAEGIPPEHLTAMASPSYTTQVGKRLVDASDLEYARGHAQWPLTAASPAAPELRGLYLPEMKDTSSSDAGVGFSRVGIGGCVLELTSVACSFDHKIAAACYSDGLVRLFSMPVAEGAEPLTTIDGHVRGLVSAQFQVQVQAGVPSSSVPSSYTLLTYGRTDNIVAAWTVAII